MCNFYSSYDRDLKPENILPTIDPVREEKLNNVKMIGAPLYMAPEVNHGRVALVKACEQSF